MRDCAHCTNNPTCWGRIELARTVQGFKYLAMTESEAKNIGALNTVNAIYQAFAGACNEWEKKK